MPGEAHRQIVADPAAAAEHGPPDLPGEDAQVFQQGSCVLPANAEECKENISFIFQDRVFESFEEFQTAIIIDNKNILQLEKPLEILRAGIIDNEPMLKTPWGDKRLADKAVNK